MIWHRVHRVARDESGSALVLVTMLIVALLLLAGLVIDVGGVWGFRANQQSISDASAAAAAIVVAESGDGQAGCNTAKAYIVTNSRALSSLSGIDCTSFPSFCDSSTPAVSAATSESAYTVTIQYPVPDDSLLMDSALRGALDQPASAADGTQCDRFGVGITTQVGTTLSKLAGIDTIAADVHSVARSQLSSGGTVPVNLLVLDRTGCQTLRASGNGGIYVDAVYDPITGTLDQGLAASDSDGSDGCAGGDGVIDVDGSNSVMRADGPICPDQTGVHLIGGLPAGEGCGRIQTLAPGTPGCNFPACTFGGSNPPNPDPTELYQRLTRAPIDHTYNCKDDYTVLAPGTSWATEPLTAALGQDIRRCATPAAPHIDNLIAAVGEVGVPSGFQIWTAAGYPCVVQGSPGSTILVPSGDWYVDCPAFENKRTVVFRSGNVVFEGSVDVVSGAVLAINAQPVTFDPATPEAWVFLRKGFLRKAGDATLVMNNTTVYASKNAHIEMAGGSGALTWVAPNQGVFDDLALWGDSPTTHLWAGQAELTLEGVFFTPFAQAEYAGTAGQNQIRAQFIANSLHARGQGTLVVSPEYGRTVQFPAPPESTLIR